MKKIFNLLVLIALLSVSTISIAQNRFIQSLDKGWKFARQDIPGAEVVGVNDNKWQSVTIPHDWVIYGPFSVNNDKQNVAITQDGQKEAMEHAGRAGGLPFIGCGWYRLKLDEIPSFVPGKRVTQIFDGAMSHAQVHQKGLLSYSRLSKELSLG